MQPIYLDNAATTPLTPEVREAMAPFLDGMFANPSSKHPAGAAARAAIDRAREQLARALGARPAAITFTSGGTEANNLAVLGLARAASERGRHVLVGPSEHPSVRESAVALRAEGFEIEEARLDADGALDVEDWARRLRPDTVLVAQMFANNEYGSVYPIPQLARELRARAPHALLHVDAVQAFGKLDVRMQALGADSISISAHKIHGPKGAGALIRGDRANPRPLVFGGGQEGDLRPGTENVATIAGFGLAAELADADQPDVHRRMGALRAHLVAQLESIEGLRILSTGGAEPPLPNIVSVLVRKTPAEVYQHHLAEQGVFVSTGSACQASKRELSPALLALGLEPDEARRVLRVSLSRFTTESELETAAQVFADVASKLG